MTVVLGVGCTLLYTIVYCCTLLCPVVRVNQSFQSMLANCYHKCSTLLLVPQKYIVKKYTQISICSYVNVSKCYAFCPSWLRAAHELPMDGHLLHTFRVEHLDLSFQKNSK